MISASEILGLLATRHSDDLFVAECKNGPTQSLNRGDGLLRLDAWVMARSWRHPKCTAYEIKVNRGDFLRDDKWRDALDWCNEFYWVCPMGVIDPAEIGMETGLMLVSKNCGRLHMKKRAPYREIEAPVDLLTYVLMCRTRIQKETFDQRAYWTEWLAQKDEDRTLGREVSKKIRELVKARIQDVTDENWKLRDALKDYEGAARVLEEHGLGCVEESARGRVFVPLSTAYGSLQRAVEEARRVVPTGLVERLREAADALEGFVKAKSSIDGGQENG